MPSEAEPETSPPTPAELDELKQPEFSDLLRALIQRDRLTYEDVARLMRKNVGAFRTQRHRTPLLQTLILPSGKISSRRGPSRSLFKLNESWRDAVNSIVASQKEISVEPAIYRLPALETIRTLISQARSERHQFVRRAYQIWHNADRMLGALEEKISSQVKVQKFGRIDGQVIESIHETKRDLQSLYHTISSDSAEKRRQYFVRVEEVVFASPRRDKIDRYFSHVPDNSFSGYGGAVNARADDACDKWNLDIFFAEKLNSPETSTSFLVSIGHVVRETIGLTAYDEGWTPVAYQLLDAVRQSPTLSTLSSVREALNNQIYDEQHDPEVGKDARELGAHNAEMRSLEPTLPHISSMIAEAEALV